MAPAEIAKTRAALRLVEERGFHRERNLSRALDDALLTFGK